MDNLDDDESLVDPISLFDYEQHRVLKCSEITNFTIEDPGYFVDLEPEERRAEELNISVPGQSSFTSDCSSVVLNAHRPLDIKKIMDHNKFENCNSSRKKIVSPPRNICVKENNCKTLPITVKKTNLSNDELNCSIQKTVDNEVDDDVIFISTQYLETNDRCKNTDKKKCANLQSKTIIDNNKKIKSSGMKAKPKNIHINKGMIKKRLNKISKVSKIKDQDLNNNKEMSIVDIYEKIIAKACQNLKKLLETSSSNINNFNNNNGIYLSDGLMLNTNATSNNVNECSTNICSSKPCGKNLKQSPLNNTKVPQRVRRSKSLQIASQQNKVQHNRKDLSYTKYTMPNIHVTNHFNNNTSSINNTEVLIPGGSLDTHAKNTSESGHCLCSLKDKISHNPVHSQYLTPIACDMVIGSSNENKIKNKQEINRICNNQSTASNSPVVYYGAASVPKRRRSSMSSGYSADQFSSTSTLNICPNEIQNDDKIIPHYHKKPQIETYKKNTNLIYQSEETTQKNISVEQKSPEKLQIYAKKDITKHKQSSVNNLKYTNSNYNNIEPNQETLLLPYPLPNCGNLSFHTNSNSNFNKQPLDNYRAMSYIPVLLSKHAQPIQQRQDNLSPVYPIPNIVTNRAVQNNYYGFQSLPKTPYSENPFLAQNRTAYQGNNLAYTENPYKDRNYVWPQVNNMTQIPSVRPPQNAQSTLTKHPNIKTMQQYNINISNKSIGNILENTQQFKHTNNKIVINETKNRNNAPSNSPSIKKYGENKNYCKNQVTPSLKTQNSLANCSRNTTQQYISNNKEKIIGNITHNIDISSNMPSTSSSVKAIDTNNTENKNYNNSRKTSITKASTLVETQKHDEVKRVNNNSTELNMTTFSTKNFHKYPELKGALERPPVINKNLSPAVNSVLHIEQISDKKNNTTVKPLPENEYSSPILPILSYENIVEILSSDDFVNYCTQYYKFLKIWPLNRNTSINKQPCNSPIERNKANSDYINKKGNKISLREYKRRLSNNNKPNDLVGNETDITKTSEMSFANNEINQDINYDSDATVQL